MGVLNSIARVVLQRVNVCTVSLAPLGGSATQGQPAVLFKLWVAGDYKGSVLVAAEEIGVPSSLSEARSRQHSDEGYQLPPTLLDYAQSALPAGEPLYLAFESPWGYLAGAPWERMLRTELELPVLRLATIPIRPVRAEGVVEIAYCCSLPAKYPLPAAQIVDDFIDRLPEDLPRRARLHVFADRDVQAMVRKRAQAIGAWQSVEIYPPGEAERYVGPRASGNEMLAAEALENPWLLWIRDSLKRISLDAIHFYCAGYVGRGGTGLQFAHSPGDPDYAWSRLVGARQLGLFLEQTGAWTMAVSVLRERGSVLGLRMLLQEMTRMVTGPLLLHETAADPSGEALRQAYRFIFAPEVGLVPTSPALSIVTNPFWTSSSEPPDSRLQGLVQQFTLQHKVPGLTSAADTPAWLTAQQRSLEKTIGMMADEPRTEREDADQRGRLEALAFTSDLIARLATKTDDPGKGAA